MTGVDLRLGGAVVEAADLLARELGGADANVEHVAAKGKAEEKFAITIEIYGSDGDERSHVSIDLPAVAGDAFAERVSSLANDASNYRRGSVRDVKDSDHPALKVHRDVGEMGG